MSLDLRGRPFDPAGQRPRCLTDSIWGFLLEELPGDRTRLVVSGYWTLRPRWLQPVMSLAGPGSSDGPAPQFASNMIVSGPALACAPSDARAWARTV